MPPSVPQAMSGVHPVTPEARPGMLKADLRKADLRRDVGQAVDRARMARGWTLDEFSGHLPAAEGHARRDARQVARWISGVEHAQFDVLFACDDDDFVELLFVQLAPLSRRYEPVITVRRTA